MKITKAVDIKTQLTEQLLHSTGTLRKSMYLIEGFKFLDFITDPLSGINGIGLGYDREKEYFIKVYTERDIRIKKDYLTNLFQIAPQDILVQNIGPIKPLQRTIDRIRPAIPGISIGHISITAGTFGCVVVDDVGNFYILSNNHVLANCNKCNIGDAILQPGPIDNGTDPQDQIATLSEYIPIDFTGINSVDAAIASPLDPFQIDTTLPIIGRIAGVGTPKIGMSVAKFGRTTGYTTGIIISRSVDIKVNFEGQLVEFENQLEIVGNRGAAFSAGGDSGSIIIDIGTKQAVGLLFAGTQDGRTFANPMMTVLNNFDLKIA